MHSLVFEMPGRCVSRAVACCYRTGWVVLVLGMQLSLWLFMGHDDRTSVVGVALLVLIDVVMMLLHAFVGVRNAMSLCFKSSGMLL